MRNDDDGGALAPQNDDEVWATLVRFSRTPLSAEDRMALEQWSAEDATRRDMVRAVQRLATVVPLMALVMLLLALHHQICASSSPELRNPPRELLG